MYQKACREQNFQRRTGDSSTCGTSSGRVDVLPKEFQQLEVVQSSLKDILDTLHHNKAKLEREMRRCPQGTQRFTEMEHTLNRVRGQLGNMKKFFAEVKAYRFETVFCFVAEHMLSGTSLTRLRDATFQIMGKPPIYRDNDPTAEERAIATHEFVKRLETERRRIDEPIIVIQETPLAEDHFTPAV